jgi:hypothetical protein
MQISLRWIVAGIAIGAMLVVASVSLAITLSFSHDAAVEQGTAQSIALGENARNELEKTLERPVRYIRGIQYRVLQSTWTLAKDDPNFSQPKVAGKPLSTDEPVVAAKYWGVGPWFAPYQDFAMQALVAAEYAYTFNFLAMADKSAITCAAGEPWKPLIQRVAGCLWLSPNNRSRTGQSDMWYTAYNASTGKIISGYHDDWGYDPTLRFWYRNIKPIQYNLMWHGVLLGNDPVTPQVYISGALHNRSGHYLGVWMMAFDLYFLVPTSRMSSKLPIRTPSC